MSTNSFDVNAFESFTTLEANETEETAEVSETSELSTAIETLLCEISVGDRFYAVVEDIYDRLLRDGHITMNQWKVIRDGLELREHHYEIECVEAGLR